MNRFHYCYYALADERVASYLHVVSCRRKVMHSADIPNLFGTYSYLSTACAPTPTSVRHQTICAAFGHRNYSVDFVGSISCRAYHALWSVTASVVGTALVHTSERSVFESQVTQVSNCCNQLGIRCNQLDMETCRYHTSTRALDHTPGTVFYCIYVLLH